MEKSINAMKASLQKVRTGRASIGILDGIMVDYYGTMTPLKQLATLAVPELGAHHHPAVGQGGHRPIEKTS